MSSSRGHHLVISITVLVHSLTLFASITAINGDLSYVMSSLKITDVGTQLQKMGDDLNGAHSKHGLLLVTGKLFAWCLRALREMCKAVT